jgi:hypothetical protein
MKAYKFTEAKGVKVSAPRSSFRTGDWTFPASSTPHD